jgi:RNA polymerase sigma-70 factor (ECF subfamily)
VDETILIQKSQQGDMEAFEQLLLRYEKKVYTIAYKYMGNHEDANDLAQEALIKAYRSIGSFRGDASFGTWIGRITANQCLDELRKRKRIQITSLDDEVELEEGSVQKEVAAEADTPEEYTLRQETVQYVQEMLGQLREEYRIVLVLRELEGHSYEDIAQMLSCSLGTVKSRISRARTYLKEQILANEREQEGRRNHAGR